MGKDQEQRQMLQFRLFIMALEEHPSQPTRRLITSDGKLDKTPHSGDTEKSSLKCQMTLGGADAGFREVSFDRIFKAMFLLEYRTPEFSI